VANDSEFQEQMKRLGKLVEELDRLPESAAKATGKELVQLLMEVHGAGLECVMEIVFESGEAGPALIHKLGQDSIVCSLLLLYSLHPDDLQTRVIRAVERMRPRLRKLATAVELIRADDGEKGYVQLRLATSGHNCGSSTKDLRTIVEDCVYEFAPDVTTLEILGLEEPAPNGFVALDSLLGQSLAAVGANLPNGHLEQRTRHE
jgi:Fe-S cluster biogenesis protein NfuA